MLDQDSISDFVLGARLNGHSELLPLAKLAASRELELTVVDRDGEDYVVVTCPDNGRWLDASLSNLDDIEDLENMVTEFHDIASQFEWPDGPSDDDVVEALAVRIVDILLEWDIEDFVSGFSKDQERLGGRPLDPTPTGKEILRAVQFETGHKLYIWRTDRQREHYGYGPNSFYLGYRLVSPTGQIIFEDSGFHPGGSWRGEVTDNEVLMLIQWLSDSRDNLDEEDIAKMTPAQLEWLDSEARERIEMDVSGHDGFEEGYRAPWRELKVRRPRKRS